MKKKPVNHRTVALLGVGAVALSSPEWRANTIFATAKRYNWHGWSNMEEEIVKGTF